MSKGPTKAQQALAEAREWISASKEEVAEREAELLRARSQLEMHETIYAILDKTLTRQSSQKSASRSTKRSASKSTKSKRASGMAAAISGSLQRSRSATGGLPDGVSQLCVAQIDDNGGLMECGEAADHNVHHLNSHPDHHPFQPPASTAAQGSTPASSGIDGGGAGNVVREQSSSAGG